MSVGARSARFDAIDKVTGAAAYPAEQAPADTVVARAVFSNEPHARLVSLDTSDAEAVPGVLFVLTADDVPVNEYGLTMFDQPVFIGTSARDRARGADVSRWEADHLALIVADDLGALDEAADRLIAEWEPLPVVADVDEALAPDAPLVHAESGLDSNIYHRYRADKGDLDRGFREAEVIVEGTYELPYQEHAYLQPEAGLAYVDDDGRITVEIAGQWTHEDQEQIAHALDLDPSQIRVIYPTIGGAFGGREDMSLQIVLALAAQRLHRGGDRRPVRSHWSREESVVGHHKRHRARAVTRWGARLDGTITAVEATVTLDAGAYNYTSNKVLGNFHLTVGGPYRIPNVRIESRAVYTTTVPGGAFRGFGGPQGCFVAEMQMNKLAEALAIDPIELRRRNVLRDGDPTITHTPLPDGVTLEQVIDSCAATATRELGREPAAPFSPIASLTPEIDAIRTGCGFACGYKNIGFSFGFPERCEAEIVLHGPPATADSSDPSPEAGDPDAPWRVELFHAGAEVGQGAHQAFLQMASEATGVPLERVDGRFSDTATSGDSGSASASRLSWMAGNSILAAAAEAEKAWIDGDRPARGHARFTPPETEMLDPEGGPSRPNFAYGYMAQAVSLSVDVETGHIVVHDVISTHDVGRAINPVLVEAQIEGAVVQAHGYALSEDLRVEQGRIVNPRLSSYLIPGIGDVPDRVIADVLELADPLGPWGARGVAEMPMLTYAPAVIAAFHDATGVWVDQFPLTPSRVLAALADC